MNVKFSWLFCLGFLTVGPDALGQERPNSAQYHAVHNPNSPHYVGSNQQQGAPQISWLDRWGAIASDATGEFGIVSAMNSKHEAEAFAVEECRRRGGGECQVQLTYHNQCAAVSSSPSKSFSNGAASEDEAKELALKRCEESGTGSCRVFYSGCSLPVQAQ